MDFLSSASFVIFASGVFLGSLITFFFLAVSHRRHSTVLEGALKETERSYRTLLESFSNQLTAHLHKTSHDSFSKSTETLMKLAGNELNKDREMITHDLKHNKEDLQKLFDSVHAQISKFSDLIHQSEKDKGIQMAKIASLITTANTQTADLIETTTGLKAILTSSQTRGQLGERIAEDVLKYAGFIENVNYVKQKALPNGTRPDFTFLLPKGLVLNMDVKFPIQNYTRYIQANDKAEKDRYCKAFLSDVRACYKELEDRAYHELPESVDCVVLLIPHEQVFSFIMQEDHNLVDQALTKKVLTCSPMTLFAVLAVVRKAIDHFTLEKTSHDILEQLAAFRKQWEMFCSKFQVLGKRIGDLQTEYDGILNTRTRLLDKQLEKLDRLQQEVELSQEELV